MEEKEINFKEYWQTLIHHSWLLIVGLVLGATLGFGASQLQTPVYQATTQLMVTRSGMTGQALDTYSTIYNDQLTQTYLQLLQTDTVLNSVSDRLGIDLDDVIIDAQAIQDTAIIEISVEYTSPEMAASIANTLVDVLVEKNEEIQSSRYVSMEESLLAQKMQLEAQIAALQNQIEQASISTIAEQEVWLQDQISSLEEEAANLTVEINALGTPATAELRNILSQKEARLEQVNMLLPLYKQSYTDLMVYGKQVDAAKSTSNSQLNILTTTQSLYQQIYQSVLSNLETVRLASMENTPGLVPIETAVIPEEPVRPQKLRNSALAGIAGLLLTTGGLFFKEFLDDSIKVSDDIERLLGLTTIGYIAEMKISNKDSQGVFVLKHPRSQITEAFRSLCTDIEFLSFDKPIKTILVTSAEPGTGKTTIAANLAIIFTQKGRHVMLLDADLRQPHLHQVMKLENSGGLTDLLMRKKSIPNVIQKIEDIELLSIISSGILPPNPTELLSSEKMDRLLEKLTENQDVLIIDSPPSIVADAQVLAAKVDAVLLVIQPGKTQKKIAKTTVEVFKRANARIIGVVMNHISQNSDYYSQYHYEGYFDNSPQKE